ncbi:hypothetical protein Plec18167_006963 [Paecilomyces lecythidis]|uniref:Uncharacterized protein n=1 Tax=Paecilomyces lecythidis TaxID=3004212 RepID=A0ABR3X830_9EURO
MRIFYSLRRLMGDIYIFLLFSSVFTLASPFDSVPQNVASLFRRSIPGSLGWAPAGAVGYYQPPPGPITKPPVPTETKAASTSASEITHELRRQLVTETGTVPRQLAASATGTSSSTESNLANKDAVLGMAGILAPALVAMLQV